MTQPQGRLQPDRLVEAADAVLTAATEIAARLDGAPTTPLQVAGTPAQPQCLTPFSIHEVEQAYAFLVRLGFLDNPYPKKAA